jgi:D-alanyl-D-alanine carboxypeptidase
MNQPLRFSSAASLVVIGTMIAGCAAPQSRVGAASHLGGRTDADLGLATRAAVALNAHQVPLAIELAERAVAKNPDDAGFRTLLGNAYFAGGRFRSAEAAFTDSLTIYGKQPQVVLKLALAQIALGNNAAAVQSLDAGRPVLDTSDYGLALALAGRADEAIAVLDPAARQVGADATVRQNLALAHALRGDWAEAKTIAAQDVPAGQLDARMQQRMQLASPRHASDQVAALVGVTPAASDAGQPVQLALNKGDTRLAQSTDAPAQQNIAAAAPAAEAPAKPAFVATAAPQPMPAPVLAVAPAPPPPRAGTLAALAESAVNEAKSVLASVMHNGEAPKAAKPRRAVLLAHRGNSSTVVQLGSYGSADRVLAAWDKAARKYSALKSYAPMSARFASPKGTFYRLSIRGFSGFSEANALCNSLKAKGGSCFVRNFAGDTPVQYAAR